MWTRCSITVNPNSKLYIPPSKEVYIILAIWISQAILIFQATPMQQEDDDIEIFVKNLKGQTISLDVDAEDPIKDMKPLIQVRQK